MMQTAVDKEHLHLRIVQEISDFVNKSTGLDTILKGVVNKVSQSLHFGVVSIYIIEKKSGRLRLMANKGLEGEPENSVTLEGGEGIAGMIFKTMRPFVSMNVSRHPNYKLISNIGEEKYDCYLGVPIVLNNRCMGVLVGQTSEKRHITPAEQTLFEIIASRLAGLLEVADTLDRLHTPSIVEHKTRTYQGVGASPGVAVGKALLVRGLFGRMWSEIPSSRSPEKEKERLLEALTRVEKDMKDLIGVLKRDKVLSRSEVEIFETHMMLLSSESEDSIRKVLLSNIENNRTSAENAVVQGIESIAGRFEHHSDRYVREKAQDFRDIGEKLLHELVGLQNAEDTEDPDGVADSVVLVAREIGPSFISMLGKNRIAGVITEKGGETSHAVIIAKSLGIPVVIGIENVCKFINSGDRVIVDGRAGFVFVNPDETLISEYESSGKRIKEMRHIFENEDSRGGALGISLTANIGFPEDTENALSQGVRDVGLFRTEFAFARFENPPSVDEQTKIYTDIAGKFGGCVTVRTLDIGADKVLPYFNIPEEENPLLGLRAIRFSMEYLDMFREQIKSILLATSSGANLRILLPMVSNIWEVETARQIMDDLAVEIGLAPEKIPPLGVMLEVPALVPLLEDYSKEVDFISVGTNDLVQYLLAVDRNSTAVGHLYTSFHPAVLRVLDSIRKVADANKIEVSICGEMAGSSKGTLLILALGYKNLSVSPYRIPVVRFIANRVGEGILSDLRDNLMLQKRESEIERLLADCLETIDPALAEV